MTKLPASLATLSLIFAVLPLAHTSAAEAGGKAKELLAEEATFDGTGNDAIKLGDLALKAPATLSFSIKPGDTAPDRRILSQADGAATQAGALRLAGGHLQIWNGGDWLALLTRPLPAGEWTDIALVFGDESTVTALRNGKADPAVTSRADFIGVAATLGGKFLGQYGEPFLGSIKSVRIENRAIPFEASKAPKTGNWQSMMTIAERKRDAEGKLLPLQPYGETIRRGMSFLLKDHLKWFKGPPATLLDEQGNTQMPWVYYSNLQQDGTPFTGAVDGFVAYPAFHHALLIRTFIGYSKYANDQRPLKEAVKLADWDIAHSTPGDWAYAGLPYSTFAAKKPGGFRDGSGLMPDKAAIMALAYLQLHEATREKRFLQAAEAIATTLGKRQRPNGTWPFRVDPKTEAVIEDYSSSVIYAVMLFEKLDKLNGNHGYQACRDRTWNWLLNGPIKTKEFRGFYEDIPASKDGRTNYDCLDTIRYLLANRTDTNGYLEMAKDLNTWVEKTFMDTIKGFEPAEGIREQLQCNVVMGIHSLNWASMLLDLAKATGDEKLKQRADQTANYITYYLQPDNRIVVGFQYNQWWYSCHAGVILYLLDFSLVGVGHAEQVAHANRLYTFDTVDNGGTTTPTTPVQFDAALTGQTLVQGAEGKALQFNAGNRGVLLGDLGLKAPATISLWLKRTSAPADMRVFSQLEGSGTQAGALRLRGLVLEIWDGRQWLPLANISDKGVWQHLALVFSEDGNLACYLNGRQTRVVTCRADFDGVPTGLGAPYLGTYGEPFQGAMDEFQIQSRALGADAVKALVPQPLLAAAKAAESEQGNWQSVAVAVKKAPIRTGWNTQVHQQFIHPPVFSYEPVEGADKYAFAIGWERGSATLESATPEVDLAKVWEKLPRTGHFVVAARAVDAEGKVLTESQSPARRKPDFKGPFRPATSGYSEAGKKTAEWLIRENLDENRDDAAGIQNIRKFPTLYYASFIRLLTAAIREQPNGAGNKAALERATRYGQALLDNRTPAAWAYAQVPLTHRARGNTAQFSDDFKVLQVSRIAMAGLALLDLHEATHDKKWLDATVDIAKALKQNQLPEGRWPWRVNPETGVSVDDYTSDQAQAILLLDDLIAKHGRNEFLEARDKAVAWMLENPCKTLRWEGQWDDAIVVPPYTNLEWYDTGLFAEYLLRHATAENGYALIALQLASYIEDQFVEWEPTGNVITPGVREQYACYAVIDWHCAHYIRLCLAFHAATKDELWLKKARAMADTLTAVQHPEGCFPTWMSHTPVPGNPTALNNINYRMVFSNCSSYVGEMLLRLGAYTQSGTLRKDK